MEENTRLYRVELGININRLLYIRQITNKDLLYSTENSTQHPAITYKGKNLKNNGHVYTHDDITFCTPETDTTP